ncbi:helix-turn-helix transcriptional regulator [Agrococcus sp. Marseille-Q4369]|uniref:helix-turn-helix transcriptional regulator n=1 Tax=Agrococcus sp. Marseille-Q4369 TaxID=2810513 RepID=UPI001B8D5DAC|nr:helix-turn-helix transcriptional regulator [Agrococcus sp. Marseille-Q4369]QUW18690.1 helix-turn-helix transcriptional regulator [Agrococcus sp. Marseille-Q4369]
MASPDALRGHVDAMLLSVLADGPVHGYGAIERIRERSDGVLDFPSGTVYPALKRLEGRGLIEGEWASSGRSKRVYRLTPAGTRALADERSDWAATSTMISRVLGAARA